MIVVSIGHLQQLSAVGSLHIAAKQASVFFRGFSSSGGLWFEFGEVEREFLLGSNSGSKVIVLLS